MKKVLFFILVFVLIASLGPGSGNALAQSGPVDPNADAKYGYWVPVQGRLLSNTGAPLNGNFNVTFKLYSVSTGGTALCSNTISVAVSAGLFSTRFPCDQVYFDGRALWVGVSVGADAEMTPRLSIQPVPYAFSIMPGARIIDYFTAANQSALYVVGENPGASGALSVVNNDPGGIAAWLKTTSADSTLVLENTGTGPLVKGFGSNGGEDEFRINNDGSIQSLGDTTLFFPGNLAYMDPAIPSSNFTINNNVQGITIVDKMDGSNFDIMMQLSVPSMEYGFPVDVEEITIYYKVSSSNVKFTRVYLGLMPAPTATTDIPLQDVSGTYNSLNYTGLIIPMTHFTLGPDQGLLHLRIYGSTWIMNDTINFYGVRIRLGHTNMDY